MQGWVSRVKACLQQLTVNSRFAVIGPDPADADADYASSYLLQLLKCRTLSKPAARKLASDATFLK
jgi:hypothetical protein